MHKRRLCTNYTFRRYKIVISGNGEKHRYNNKRNRIIRDFLLSFSETKIKQPITIKIKS